jgi:subtilase-type serine protease
LARPQESSPGGDWTLTGDQTYANNFNIYHGASVYTDLKLMAGQVVAQNGGKLGGSGTFTQIVSDGGVLSPGGDGKIGTMTSLTSLSSNGGATILIDVLADGSGDKLVSLGESDNDWMNVDHTHFIVNAAAGNYAPATTYVIATAAAGVYEGVNGATVDDNFAFLDSALSADDNVYDADHNFINYGKNLYLTLTRNDLQFFQIAKTANQIAAANAVAAVAGSDIYNTIVPLSEDEALDAFTQLAGEVHASVGGALASESGVYRDAITDQVDAAFQALGLGAPGAAQGYAENAVSASPAQKFNFWMQGVVRSAEAEGDGNASGFAQSTGGLLLGVDTALSNSIVTGIFGGIGQTNLELNDLAQEATSGNYTFGAYAGASLDDVGLKVGASYTAHQIDSTRNVNYQNVNQTLTASYDASTAQIFGEASLKLALTSALNVKPFLRLAYVNHTTEAFAEEGGSAALSSDGYSSGAGIVTIGLSGETKFAAGDGMLVTLDAAVAWQHSTDGAPTSDLALAGDSFTVAGTSLGGDTAVLNAGLSVDVSDNLVVGAGYTGQFAEQAQSHALRASVGAKF